MSDLLIKRMQRASAIIEASGERCVASRESILQTHWLVDLSREAIARTRARLRGSARFAKVRLLITASPSGKLFTNVIFGTIPGDRKFKSAIFVPLVLTLPILTRRRMFSDMPYKRSGGSDRFIRMVIAIATFVFLLASFFYALSRVLGH